MTNATRFERTDPGRNRVEPDDDPVWELMTLRLGADDDPDRKPMTSPIGDR